MPRGGHFQQYKWDPEVDELIWELADGIKTVSEILTEVRKMTGDNRSVHVLRHHMRKIGAPIRKWGGKTPMTDQMWDYLYVLSKRGLTLSDIREEFNDFFGTQFSNTLVWRLILDVNGDKERPITRDVFIDEWTKLQGRFAPDGEICRRHWLWRWTRLDEERTAAGCVFSGAKVRIPKK